MYYYVFSRRNTRNRNLYKYVYTRYAKVIGSRSLLSRGEIDDITRCIDLCIHKYIRINIHWYYNNTITTTFQLLVCVCAQLLQRRKSVSAHVCTCYFVYEFMNETFLFVFLRMYTRWHAVLYFNFFFFSFL